jgi:mono/diheme cytochrome c family protein
VRHRAFVHLVALLGACTLQGATDDQPVRATRDRQAFDAIERGRYLAIVGDCAACHTAPGGRLYAGGRAIETPFGTLVSPNLTPDRETGIGAASDADFVNALEIGRGRGGAHLYPAMPYTSYTKASRNDLLAIRVFLDTVEPVRNEVKTNQLPFPLNIRASMAAWNALFFTPGKFAPVAGKSDEWNAGAYLVEGLGHCGVCHTAKNKLGGDETSRTLQGGLLQGWYAPDITGDGRTGLGSWSVDDIVAYLKTGSNRTTAATGPMSEVINDSTSLMRESDLRAIAVYLKDLPARQDAAPAPVPAEDAAMRAGQAIYADNCAACHTDAGSGIARLFPTLKGSPSVQSADPTNLIRIVLQGAQSVATAAAPTGPSMPALGWKLSDGQVASVTTYIRNSWGNAAAPVPPGNVERARRQLTRAAP